MNPEIFLIGAGGFASDFVACFSKDYKIAGCWDDQLTKGTSFNGLPVLGTIADLVNTKNSMSLVITIANPSIRQLISGKLGGSVHEFPELVHSSASLFDSDTIKVGKGCIIFPGVIITTQVNLGEFVVLHVGTSVHHNVNIGNCSVLMPGARITGDVNIGKNVFIGPGQTLSHGDHVPDGKRIIRTTSF